MKKFISKLMYATIIVATSFSFVACSDDDEPGTGGNTNLNKKEITSGQIVDLGLSVNWSGWNIGASSPEGYGDYYAWGETSTSYSYDYNNYSFWEDINGNGRWDSGEYTINSNIDSTKYDVALQKWGGSWRMPTKEQFEELLSKCTWSWYQYKGVDGYRVTGPNGNSIFLPAAGHFDGDSLVNVGVSGYYWSASLYDTYNKDYVWDFDFHKGYDHSYYSSNRHHGHSIRPVTTEEAPIIEEEEDEPAINEPLKDDRGVDLGLTSGILWALQNVGANSPEEYGDYYAWGEINIKKEYSLNTYTYMDDDGFIDIGSDISGTKYDVVARLWGGGWCMPTKSDFDELINECDWTWSQVNNVNGYTVTGPNGNSIFLPAADYKGTLFDYDPGDDGYYWTATSESEYGDAYCVYFYKPSKPEVQSGYPYNYNGLTIRPVKKK